MQQNDDLSIYEHHIYIMKSEAVSKKSFGISWFVRESRSALIGRFFCVELNDLFSLQQDDKSGKEAILDDTECPLQIFRDWPADRGNTHTHTLFLASTALYCCVTVITTITAPLLLHIVVTFRCSVF